MKKCKVWGYVLGTSAALFASFGASATEHEILGGRAKVELSEEQLFSVPQKGDSADIKNQRLWTRFKIDKDTADEFKTRNGGCQ